MFIIVNNVNSLSKIFHGYTVKDGLEQHLYICSVTQITVSQLGTTSCRLEIQVLY